MSLNLSSSHLQLKESLRYLSFVILKVVLLKSFLLINYFIVERVLLCFRCLPRVKDTWRRLWRLTTTLVLLPEQNTCLWWSACSQTKRKQISSDCTCRRRCLCVSGNSSGLQSTKCICVLLNLSLASVPSLSLRCLHLPPLHLKRFSLFQNASAIFHEEFKDFFTPFTMNYVSLFLVSKYQI